VKNIEFNQIPKELEGALQDAAFEVARTYEAFQRAAPEDKAEAELEFHAAAHMVEKIVKQGVSAADGILNENSLQTIVRGQLKTSIAVHGPITSPFVGSAARRIANDLLGHFRQASLRDISNTAAATEVERLRKELKQAQDLLGKKQEQIRDLKVKLGL
jgi:hypothetical protein